MQYGYVSNDLTTMKDGHYIEKLSLSMFYLQFHNFYLGIHWIIDIAGGMIVAFIAVNLADKTSKPIWSILDERTINAS